MKKAHTITLAITIAMGALLALAAYATLRHKPAAPQKTITAPPKLYTIPGISIDRAKLPAGWETTESAYPVSRLSSSATGCTVSMYYTTENLNEHTADAAQYQRQLAVAHEKGFDEQALPVITVAVHTPTGTQNLPAYTTKSSHNGRVVYNREIYAKSGQSYTDFNIQCDKESDLTDATATVSAIKITDEDPNE